MYHSRGAKSEFTFGHFQYCRAEGEVRDISGGWLVHTTLYFYRDSFALKAREHLLI